jgi:hypothetical protein
MDGVGEKKTGKMAKTRRSNVERVRRSSGGNIIVYRILSLISLVISSSVYIFESIAESIDAEATTPCSLSSMPSTVFTA